MAETADVVVVGAGAVGGACAFHLAQAGLRVALLEREEAASGSSGHATGSLSLLSTDFNTEAHLRLGVASYNLTRDLLPRLEELSGVDTQYQVRPALRLALDEEEVALIREGARWQGHYVPSTWIDGDEVRRLEPRLSPAVRGAAYQEESLQLDAASYARALVGAAQRLGARMVRARATGLRRANGRVTGVGHTGGAIDAAWVVLAMGPWAAVAGRWLGFDVPVRPLWGERLQFEWHGPPLAALIASPKRGHLISRRDGYLSVGSTAGRDFDNQGQYLLGALAEDGFVAQPTDAALAELRQRAADVLPAAANLPVARRIAGVRPLSPDRRPIIGFVPGVEGVILATGHGTKGVHLAAATGVVVADLVARGASDVDLTPFAPARFAERAAAGLPADDRPPVVKPIDD